MRSTTSPCCVRSTTIKDTQTSEKRKTRVRAWDANPANSRPGATSSVRFPSGPPVVTARPGYQYIINLLTTPDSEDVYVLCVDDSWIFKLRMEDSFPLFSMALTDERDEVLLLIVDD